MNHSERDFSKIRLHLKRYRMLRAIERFWHKLCHWLRWLGYLKYLNPFRYLNRLDRYIINKFIGTYIYSIVLIISIAIVFDVNENLAKKKEMWEAQTSQTGGFGQNLSGADVDLWNMSRYMLLDEKKLTHRLVLQLGTDTTFWAGDTLKWRLHMPQQQGQGIVASMSLVGHESNTATPWKVLQGVTTPLLQQDTTLTLICVADSIDRLEQVVVAVHQFPAGGATERMPVVIDSLELRRIHKLVVPQK